MERILRSGSGWRLGWDASAPQFQGLVGGDDWAFELTAEELQDFCRLLVRLADSMSQMTGELMDEEKLHCEVEGDLLWLEAAGYPGAYSIRLILNQGRRGEGFWPASVVPELIQAAQILKIF
jgi:hypothetical protein